MGSVYKPLVSVVTIFLDEERFIGEAVESVLAQRYDNWELLLVDDGSTDASTEIALRYAELYPGKVRYLEHPGHKNRGRSAARNLGIADARGEYIAFLDADDVWLPRKLEQQVEILESHPEAGMVYGRTLLWYSWSGNPEDTGRDFLDSSTRLDTLFTPPDLLTLFLQQINGYPCTCGVLVRRRIVEAVGGFEEEFRGLYDDSVFWAKVFLTTPVFVTSECGDLYRQHSDSSWANALRTGEWHPTKPHPARLPFLEWLEKYLIEKEVKDSELWGILCRELRLYRHPTASVEVREVSLAAPDADGLLGRNIELPQPGSQTNDHGLAIRGWVLGRSSPAVAVEVVHEGNVVKRVPIAMNRPDIEAAFPDVPGAENSGFRAAVSVAGMGELELGVRTVLKDQSRVPLGTIRVHRRWREEDFGIGAALVSVVIPCYNQAHFLGEAIESVLAQTYAHFEVVVVDDGSTDNTEEVAARYPGVRCVRQDNRGLAEARNTGIRRSRGEYLVFLDADDRLLPEALEAGLGALKAHPECAFVAGRHRYIDFDGSPLLTPQPPRVERDHYLALLSDNFINMHAIVMYQRLILEAVGAFDASLNACEDYDLYLRIAREFPIHCHEKVVAEYRKHGANMTRASGRMLRSTLSVLRSHRKYAKSSKQHKIAYGLGLRRWQADYGEKLIDEVRAHAREREWRSALRGARTLLRYYPPWQRRGRPPVAGRVRFGSLRRLTPVSRNFGWERGGPIDRYYIEDFLARHAGRIRGRVLEIQDASYTRRFGGERVSTSDVLSLEEGNPSANIISDLTCADQIPSDSFDCVILAQTLHLIYDSRAALKTLHRILKPGGTLLATMPGISQAARTRSSTQEYWGFTILSARRLFEEVFPAGNVAVETHGNVLAATAFLHGLGAAELRREELDFRDPDYQVLITIEAIKPEAEHSSLDSPDYILGRAERSLLPGSRMINQSTTASLANQQAVILLYHQVTQWGSDPWALNVKPLHFAEHLEVLQQHVNPVRLQELTQALLKGKNLPPRSVAVTFDDGYADNLYNAKPFLERYDIPATIFLTTGYIGHERESWWNELDRLVLQPGILPETLHLQVNGRAYRWKLGEAAHYSPHSYQSHRFWRAWEEAPGPRQALYRSLYDLLYPMAEDERREVLDELLTWAGAEPVSRKTHRFLSLEEVATLPQGDLVEVGAHTVTHPALSALPVASQRDEIQQSKNRLEEIMGRSVTSFAYPYGTQEDYTAETVALVREAGFACGCSAVEGSVGSSTDRFQLPRIFVQDWEGEEFARQLSRWLHD